MFSAKGALRDWVQFIMPVLNIEFAQSVQTQKKPFAVLKQVKMTNTVKRSTLKNSFILYTSLTSINIFC